MKLLNIIILASLLIILNGCISSITGGTVAEQIKSGEFKQVTVLIEQYSSNFDFFDVTKIRDDDLTQNAWRGNGFDTNRYIILDAGEGKRYSFNAVSVYLSNGWYKAQYSDNGADWVNVADVREFNYSPSWISASWGWDNKKGKFEFTGSHRYWRLLFSSRPDADTYGEEIQWWGIRLK